MNLGVLPKGIGTLLRNKLGRDTPLLWDHKITFRCQALCGFCPFNAKLRIWNEYGPELPTQGVLSLADQMYDLGCVMSSFEGGEPLLRKDLPDVLRHCRETGFSTHLVTNGGLLKQHARRIAEFFLRHRLFRSERSGEVIKPEWLKLHYPLYWHYDVLQALRILALAVPLDGPQTQEALDLLEKRRLRDGRWRPGAYYWYPPGRKTSNIEVVDWGRGGPNRMITLNALRVLKAAGRSLPES